MKINLIYTDISIVVPFVHSLRVRNLNTKKQNTCRKITALFVVLLAIGGLTESAIAGVTRKFNPTRKNVNVMSCNYDNVGEKNTFCYPGQTNDQEPLMLDRYNGLRNLVRRDFLQNPATDVRLLIFRKDDQGVWQGFAARYDSKGKWTRPLPGDNPRNSLYRLHGFWSGPDLNINSDTEYGTGNSNNCVPDIAAVPAPGAINPLN
jgi:hypothetical protein